MKPKRGKIRSLTIIGRRWFDRKNGNTYCSAVMLVNGVAVGQTGPAYGYDDHYEWRAFSWLEANGFVTDRERHANGSHEPPWRWCERHGIAYWRNAFDLARKGDL